MQSSSCVPTEGRGPNAEHRYIQEAVQALKAYDPEKIILFGSYARDDMDSYSDLDLVLIKQTDKRFVERLVEAATYLDLPLSVDLFVYTPEEFQAMEDDGNPFIERVRKEGRIIYEKSSRDSPEMAGTSRA